MQPTEHPHVNALLTDLLPQMQQVLGSKLVGLYLYGSLVTGDFDADISDIDLLAAISDDLDDAAFDALDRMHQALVRKHPGWNGRLEIAYLSLYALKTFKTQTSPIAVISPGEPFNIKKAGKDWLMNWYMVQSKGITLFGPPPETIIDPTSQAEFIEAVKAHLIAWREYIEHVDNGPYQSYAILTMCRGLYTYTHGEQVSKQKAAAWAVEEMPEWIALIQRALVWRRAFQEGIDDPAATLPEARRFVEFVIDRVERDKNQIV
ncbi:MAG: DUF4111 domain-containing protein [Anaerolineae bacterium]|nr:DUF4111 domain-containing protein [Anaerolineae bacterium]